MTMISYIFSVADKREFYRPFVLLQELEYLCCCRSWNKGQADRRQIFAATQARLVGPQQGTGSRAQTNATLWSRGISVTIELRNRAN
jgi:hypothetical protein